MAEKKTTEKKTAKAKAPAKKAEPKTKAVKPVKAPKPKKQKKPISAKKLPGLLKKSYTQKKLDKKILKKIYIADDKRLVSSFFKDDVKHSGKLHIPQDTIIAADDFRRLKLISKEVKKQKGRINFIPLVAVVIVCAVVGITVTLFKNVVIKYALTTGMQQAFGAKTDIEDVDLQIFGSSLSITGIAQANKDKPMQNIFEIGNVTLNFNLTELLRGKFDAEEISVTEIAIGTERTVSGELAIKTSSSTEKKVSSQTSEKSAEKLASVKESITAVFSDYNPQTIISNVENNLQSPKIAEDIQKQTETLTAKYKDTPEQIKSDVDSFQKQVESVLNTNWSGISNAAELAAALKTTQEAIETGKKLKESTQSTLNSVKTDTATVKGLSTSLQSAIKNDKALVQKELDKITSFSLDTVKSLMSDSITAIGYNIFGKYYPYIEQGIAFADKMKSQSKSSTTSKIKNSAKTTGRAKGQDIYYKKDTIPTLLIEKVLASGTNFSAKALEISNDPDKREAPATFEGKLAQGKQAHSLTGTVDGRTDTSAPLVLANYVGSGYSVSTDMEILSITGSANTNITGTADKNGAITFDGTVNLSGLKLGSHSFEPEMAYNIFEKALATIKTMKIELSGEYSSDGDVNLKVSTDADNQLADAIKSLVSSELSTIKSQAQEQITAMLSEKTNGATSAISQYLDIDSLISGEGNALDSITKQLSAKQDEISAQIKKQTSDAASNAASNALKKLF